MCEEIVDTSVPQIQGQIDEIGKVILQDRVPERVVEQIIPVPQIMDEMVEVIHLVPKQIREDIDGEIFVLVPQVMEETTETAKIIPQKRVQNSTVEQITNDFMPQIHEEIVAVIQLIP